MSTDKIERSGVEHNGTGNGDSFHHLNILQGTREVLHSAQIRWEEIGW